MQNLDAKDPSLYLDSNGDNSGDESSRRTDDGFVLEKTNCNYNRAEEEFNNFESFKCNKYCPKWVWDQSEILYSTGRNGELEEIIVGPVQENRKDFYQAKKLEPM